MSSLIAALEEPDMSLDTTTPPITSVDSMEENSNNSNNLLRERLMSDEDSEEGDDEDGEEEEESDEEGDEDDESEGEESEEESGEENGTDNFDAENPNELPEALEEEENFGATEGVDDSDINLDTDSLALGNALSGNEDLFHEIENANIAGNSEKEQNSALVDKLETTDFVKIETPSFDSLETLDSVAASGSMSFDTSENNLGATAENGTSTSEEQKKSKEKVPRKRKRKKAEKTDKDKSQKKTKKRKKSKPNNLRRNIRDIMTEEHFEAETLAAQSEELERKRRLQELQKNIQQQQQKKKEEQDSQLKSLLQVDDFEKEEECIMLDSSDEGKKKDVIDISSDEDDVVITKDEDTEVDPEDPNNAGSHVNDEVNIPDEFGRVIINIGHPEEEPDIYLPPFVANNIKPHQIGGVRFLYDNLVESMTRFKTSPGLGCILAHSMGLGKTIQMISFVDVFLRYSGSKTVLVIVPINTLQNWLAEFDLWVPEKVKPEVHGAVDPRPYKVFLLNDAFKTTPARAKVIEEWYKVGGVLLMGYEMYRLLSSRKGHIPKAKKPGRKPASPVVIDIEEEDHNKNLLVDVHKALINPGPDLIICDEGHRIKNSHAGISQTLKNIRTKRRVVLTGYPLQNNLIEYWCMVDFVRPNYLGNKTEFSNMFERPILNGQCVDSTPADTQLMRYRAHVLHSLLEGFVQRRGHTVLQQALPPKQEFVFLVRMSPIQKELYKRCMETVNESGLRAWANNNPLKAFSVCCKIWNHPDVLYKILTQKNAEDNDLDIETTENGQVKKKAKRGRKSAAATSGGDNPASPFGDRKSEVSINYDWAREIFKDYTPGLLENGGKMVILFNIIEESLALGDKILVFSQSLFTLDLIEEYLSRYNVPRNEVNEKWCRNKNYFRLDGSTGAQERERMINAFNAEDQYWLFLLSTRAGSLGVNLIGANRVVVVDASWNPCHDCQAICRVYRFGQVKPSFIYRLVTDNSMEKKIYDRQITKQGMSDRVVDELQPQNQFLRGQTDNLLRFEDKDFDTVDFSNCEEEYDDYVMCNVLHNQGHFLTKAPFTHESLLIDKKELRLTKKEKRLAKQGYVMEKRMNTTYSRPSYAAFYPKGRDGPAIIRHPAPSTWTSNRYMNRPVASVKPMITTPVPMQPKTIKFPITTKAKPGVSVHKVLTSTDIVLPGTNTSTQSGGTAPVNKIPAGQNIFVIKTPKGVYIRTSEGKIFAVRSKLPIISRPSITGMASPTTATVTMATSAGAPKIIFKPSATIVTNTAKNDIASNSNIVKALSSEDEEMEASSSPSDLISVKQDKTDISRTDSSSSLTSHLGHMDFLDHFPTKESEKKKKVVGVKTSRKGGTSIIDLSKTKVPKIAPKNISKVPPQMKAPMPQFYIPPVQMPAKNTNFQQSQMPFMYQNPNQMYPPPSPISAKSLLADSYSNSMDTSKLSDSSSMDSSKISDLLFSEASNTGSDQGSTIGSEQTNVTNPDTLMPSEQSLQEPPKQLTEEPQQLSQEQLQPPAQQPTQPKQSSLPQPQQTTQPQLPTQPQQPIQSQQPTLPQPPTQPQHSILPQPPTQPQQPIQPQQQSPAPTQQTPQQQLTQQTAQQQQPKTPQPIQQDKPSLQPIQDQQPTQQLTQQNEEKQSQQSFFQPHHQQQSHYQPQQPYHSQQPYNSQQQPYQSQQQSYNSQQQPYQSQQQQSYPGQQQMDPYQSQQTYQQSYQPQDYQQQDYNSMYSGQQMPQSPYQQQQSQYQQHMPFQQQSYNNSYNMPQMGMSSMAPMPMQHGYMGFPFAPYPFPIPQPVMMASGLTGQPYMPMGMPTQMGQSPYGIGNMSSPPAGGQGQMMPPGGQGQMNTSEQSLIDTPTSNQ